jgi:hypothetical protein
MKGLRPLEAGAARLEVGGYKERSFRRWEKIEDEKRTLRGLRLEVGGK